MEPIPVCGLPLTAFAVGRALELTPEIGRALSLPATRSPATATAGSDYRAVPERKNGVTSALHRRSDRAICGGARSAGTPAESARTRAAWWREGGRLSLPSDAYNDDLPYWLDRSPPQLVIPHTLVNNDARYLLANGFPPGGFPFQLLKDAFDMLWQEGARQPKMIAGLHPRISGSGLRWRWRASSTYVQKRGVICRREDVGHWMREHPA